MERLTVTAIVDKDRTVFETGDPALGTVVVEKELLGGTHGTARRLICMGALSCYSGMLYMAMEARGIDCREIRLSAELAADNNEKGQFRVLSIAIRAVADIDEKDIETFRRVQQVMRSGCLITSSLHEGIDISYDLKALPDMGLTEE